MTDQEIFNTVWNGLKSQGFERSRRADNSGCAFRGVDGRKCAVGWLIPDDKYQPGLEMGSYSTYSFVGLLGVIGIGARKQRDLASALMNAHDASGVPEKMEAALRDVARVNRLTVPEPE